MASLPKKPSQLLIEGIKKAGGIQITGQLGSSESGYCALGAIYAGYGLSDEDIDGHDVTSANQQLFNGWRTYYPIKQLQAEGYTGYIPTSKSPIDDVIIFLNDSAKWPFWKISNWLRNDLGL